MGWKGGLEEEGEGVKVRVGGAACPAHDVGLKPDPAGGADDVDAVAEEGVDPRAAADGAVGRVVLDREPDLAVGRWGGGTAGRGGGGWLALTPFSGHFGSPITPSTTLLQLKAAWATPTPLSRFGEHPPQKRERGGRLGAPGGRFGGSRKRSHNAGDDGEMERLQRKRPDLRSKPAVIGTWVILRCFTSRVYQRTDRCAS